MFLKLLIHQSFVIIFLLKVIVVVHAFYIYLAMKLRNLLLIVVEHTTLIFGIIFHASYSSSSEVDGFVEELLPHNVLSYDLLPEQFATSISNIPP